MTGRLFLSYSRFDSAFVLRLANDLRNAGAAIWLDQLDIPPGEHWDSSIEKALNDAEGMLVIISPKSLASDNAMDEVSYALEKKKRVIPIMLTTADTPFRLRRLQQVDFTQDYQTGFGLLLRALNLNPQQPDTKPAAQSDNGEEALWEKCWSAHTVAAYQGYLRTTTSKEHLEEAWHRLDMLQKKPVSRAIKLPHVGGDRKWLSQKNIFFSLLFILLAAISWGAFQLTRTASVQEHVPVPVSPVITPVLADKPKPAPVIVADNKVAADAANIVAPVKHTTENITKPAAPVIKPVKKNPENHVPVKIITPAPVTVVQNGQVTEPKKIIEVPAASDDKKPEPPPVEPVTNNIPIRTESSRSKASYQIELPVLLVDQPNMNEVKKTEQHLKFTVTSDVQYEGQVIVRKGAIVNGSLMIGSHQTDIKLNNVIGTNGNIIRLESKQEHGRRADVETNKNYIAVIKRGTRI